MTRGAFHEAGKVRRAWSWWIALRLMIVPLLAHAAEPALSEFSAPLTGCPGRGVLDTRLAQLAEPGAAPSQARVSITRTALGYHTEVTLGAEGEARQRSFDTETCEAGVEAAAIAIALGSQPIAAPSAPVASSAAAAPPTPAAAVPPPPAAPPPPASRAAPVATPAAPRSAPPNPPATAGVAVRVNAAIGFDAFALPSVAASAELGASLDWRAGYWLEARVLGALPQDAAATNGQAHFTLFGGALRGCYLAQAGGLALGPCLGVRAYRIAGQGKGVDQALSGWQLYGGPSGGALARWSLSRRVALRASLEGLIALGSRAFLVNRATVYAPGSADISGALGCDFRF